MLLRINSDLHDSKLMVLGDNRPLSKLALEDEVRGETARRAGVYTQVHEDSSTGSTKQFASKVEFRMRSNAIMLLQRGHSTRITLAAHTNTTPNNLHFFYPFKLKI